MAKGIVAMDRVAQGQRHVQITRMDGQPVDEAEWVEELYIPEDGRLVSSGWQDESIPGCWHLMLVWWTLPHPALPISKSEMERVEEKGA